MGSRDELFSRPDCSPRSLPTDAARTTIFSVSSFRFQKPLRHRRSKSGVRRTGTLTRPERVPQTCTVIKSSRSTQRARNWPRSLPRTSSNLKNASVGRPTHRGVFCRAVPAKRCQNAVSQFVIPAYAGMTNKRHGLTPVRRLQSCRVSMTLPAQFENPRRPANRNADLGLLVSHERQPALACCLS